MAAGFANLRDVAGSLAPGVLARGRLFRSDAPWAGDPPPTIAGWPPSVVIDLRDPEEIDEEHPYARFAKVHVFSLIKSADVGQALRAPLAQNPRLIAYLAMTSEKAAPLLARIVDEVANADGPALVHCAAGKDRTGLVVALILRLCDVDRAAVVKDYLITEESRGRLMARLAERYPLEYGSDVGYAADAPLTFLTGLEAVLDVWDRAAGGAEGFYLAGGGTAENLQRLRARLNGGRRDT